jgi:hypothetical protein
MRELICKNHAEEARLFEAGQFEIGALRQQRPLEFGHFSLNSENRFR